MSEMMLFFFGGLRYPDRFQKLSQPCKQKESEKGRWNFYPLRQAARVPGERPFACTICWCVLAQTVPTPFYEF